MQPNPSLSEIKSPAALSQIPLWLKVSFTAFMAVLIPVYWTKNARFSMLIISLLTCQSPSWKTAFANSAKKSTTGILSRNADAGFSNGRTNCASNGQFRTPDKQPHSQAAPGM